MGKYNKWLGLGAGWILGGPIGGLVGLAIGSILDINNPEQKDRYTNNATTPTDFAMSLLVLIAAVMKADGIVKKTELNYVKAYLSRTFGTDTASELSLILRDLLKRNIPTEDVCNQVAHHLDYHSRLELIHLMYGISMADGQLAPNEFRVISHIARCMGISEADNLSIKATFYNDLKSAFETLEISEDATNEEVKKAYKKMALKYHPDKVSYLGEEIQDSAKQKFQKVNEAFEKIKKERGFV